MAYAGVERHASLYTQGVPTGRGDVSRETFSLAIDGYGGYGFGIFGALALRGFGT